MYLAITTLPSHSIAEPSERGIGMSPKRILLYASQSKCVHLRVPCEMRIRVQCMCGLWIEHTCMDFILEIFLKIAADSLEKHMNCFPCRFIPTAAHISGKVADSQI